MAPTFPLWPATSSYSYPHYINGFGVPPHHGVCFGGFSSCTLSRHLCTFIPCAARYMVREPPTHPHISSKGASWSPKIAPAGARDQNFTCQTCIHHKSHTTQQEHSLHLCDIPGASPQDTDTCLPFPIPPAWNPNEQVCSLGSASHGSQLSLWRSSLLSPWTEALSL